MVGYVRYVPVIQAEVPARTKCMHGLYVPRSVLEVRARTIEFYTTPL